MKLAVVGSRNFKDYKLLKTKLDELENIELIISGGANGADSLAEKYADEKGIKKSIHYAEWGRYGKAAGYYRNIDIVNESEMVIAFWDGKSKGTKLSISLAKEKNKKLTVIYY
jgi:hypothetical protein